MVAWYTAAVHIDTRKLKWVYYRNLNHGPYLQAFKTAVSYIYARNKCVGWLAG